MYVYNILIILIELELFFFITFMGRQGKKNSFKIDFKELHKNEQKETVHFEVLLRMHCPQGERRI